MLSIVNISSLFTQSPPPPLFFFLYPGQGSDVSDFRTVRRPSLFSSWGRRERALSVPSSRSVFAYPNAKKNLLSQESHANANGVSLVNV